MSSKQNWQRQFTQARAVFEYHEHGPHAAYEMATRHADFYFNTDIVLSYPALVSSVCLSFADTCRTEKIAPDWVVSYATTVSSMLVLAAKLSELLSTRFGYVDLRDDICRFHPAKGEKILLLTDDIHSGQSLSHMINLVEHTGADILPFVLTMANFSGAATFKNMKIFSLLERKVNTYSPDDCPMCWHGSPALNARQNWSELVKDKTL